MVLLNFQLQLERCPFCNVDKPSLISRSELQTKQYNGINPRYWRMYVCARCGGVVTAHSARVGGCVEEYFPSCREVSNTLPPRASDYLRQAIDSLHAPSGSIMLSASAIDAIFKDKGYKDGSLYDRIKKATDDHVITDGMSQWAHQVRLDANDQRHSDEESELPTEEDARKTLDFTMALGEFLYVLPSKVTRGIKETADVNEVSNKE